MRIRIKYWRFLGTSRRRKVRHGFTVFGHLDFLAVGEPFLYLGKIVPQIPNRECFHEL